MLELLAQSPLLLIFVVIAGGAILGVIPFGAVRLGAAGALFVGLGLGYLVPGMQESLKLLQALGLALFVYTVGLSAGQTFFTDLRKYARLLWVSVGILGLGAGVAFSLGKVLGLESALTAGIYAGALTTTPALAAATSASGSGLPSVGYSLGYPVGVIMAIVAVSLVVSRKWEALNDEPSLAAQTLFATTVRVLNPMSVRALPGWTKQKIKVSYLLRAGSTRVFVPGEDLLINDQVVLVGLEKDVRQAIMVLGEEVEEHLADNRTHVDFVEFVVSNKALAGESVAALNMTREFGAIITRIRRGDLEFLATDEHTIEIGDRLKVALPREEYRSVANFLGNSERKISQIDALSMGIGMALGLLIGLVEITLPGGAKVSLGAAAGPLIAGLLFGALQKTGPFLWQMPTVANQTIRQLGLLLFLATVGIGAGSDFVMTAFSWQGVKSGLLALVLAGLLLALNAGAGRYLGYSSARTAGTMAGLLGQPAVLAFAMSKQNDERIESGYAAIFALGIIAKILLATFLVAF